MRRRCPAKKASRLPTSSANCGLDEIGPTWNDDAEQHADDAGLDDLLPAARAEA